MSDLKLLERVMFLVSQDEARTLLIDYAHSGFVSLITYNQLNTVLAAQRLVVENGGLRFKHS